MPDPASSDSEPDNLDGVPTKEPWLFEQTVQEVVEAGEQPDLVEAPQLETEDVPDHQQADALPPVSEEHPCPEKLSEIYSSIPVDKLGPNVFLAIASSLMMDQDGTIQKGKRRDQARDMRNNTYTHIISLTHDKNAKIIFGLQDTEESNLPSYLSIIRELSSSFLLKPNQWTCPERILDQLEQSGPSSPRLIIASIFEDHLINFISSVLQCPIYVSHTETDKTYLFEGFAHLLNIEYNNRPILIDVRIGVYTGVEFDEGFQDVMKILHRYSETHSSVVPYSDIQGSLELVFRKNKSRSLNLNI